MIMIPFRLSFEEENTSDQLFLGLQRVDPVMDGIFMFDIVLNFNTAIYKKGNLIYDRKKIILSYLKLWFWLDIMSSFPYSTVI